LQKVEMYYLPDAEITCPKCEGRRYNPETLEILHKGLDLANALDLSVSDALHFFRNHLPMVKVLNTLQDMGLSYLRLGQSSDSLSGGESQRIRLARSLAKKSAEPTLFILDEPSRGLHLSEIPLLNRIFRDLCAEGHSVIQIEHSIIALEQSDWVIEMGPGAGQAGGKILFQGEARLYLKKRPQIHL
jgi:excinuclease ABC subunit A